MSGQAKASAWVLLFVAPLGGWLLWTTNAQGKEIASLNATVPRIEKALDAIATQQTELRKEVSAEIQALRRDIVDSGQHWGRALRPARGGGQ